MNDPRRHHTVPGLHLRRFANSRGQVRVVARDDFSRDFVASTDDVTVERDFYTVETDSGRSQDVEKLLATFESDGAEAITRAIEGTFPPVSSDRERISIFVAAQWLRGWDMREAMSIPIAYMAQMMAMNATKSSIRRFFKETENREVSDEEAQDLVEFAKDPTQYRIEVHPNQIIRQMLEMIPGLANMAFARKWQLLHAQEGVFLTSDAPVSMWTHPKNVHPFYGSSGFGMSDELTIPLDRHHALVLAHEAAAGEVARQVGGEHVRVLNRRTATSARRYIIHHPDDDPLAGMQLPQSQPKMSVSQPPWRMVPEDE